MRKSIKDTLKFIGAALAKESNDARVQVLKDSIFNKWNDLTEIQASLSTYLEDTEIDNECAPHSEYETKITDYMARMTQYLSVNKHGSCIGSTVMCRLNCQTLSWQHLMGIFCVGSHIISLLKYPL